MSGFDGLVEHWSKDEQFREDFRADPEAAVAGAGVRLTDEEWDTIRSFNPALLTDEALQERVSKMGC